MTPRERTHVPSPHVAEHSPHALQCAITQSTGHASVAQARRSCECAQALPPWRGERCTARVRLWNPLLQVLVQSDQKPNAVCAQSTGHSCGLHWRSSLSAGHWYPPNSARMVISRVRFCMPVPHECVHADHTVQPEVWQCSGQGPRSHDADSETPGQGLPPCWTATSMRRLRVRLPPVPHDSEHELHVDQLRTTQSTAHEALLQLCCSSSSGQPTPSCARGCSTMRLRTCTPPPHDLEHSRQPIQCDTMQLTGQGSTLHSRSFVSSGQV